jgi:acetyl/propionyl-CoA carboxylase alpha subunit
MRALLREYALLGITTNRQFLLDVITSEPFANGATDTGFLSRHFPHWQPDTPLSNEVLAIAALGEVLQCQHPSAPWPEETAGAAWTSPWKRTDGWRLLQTGIRM